MRKPIQPQCDLSVIPDYLEAGWDVTENRWRRTQTLRPDENESAYDRNVWAVPVRTPSSAS
jgi:hypothetical protein